MRVVTTIRRRRPVLRGFDELGTNARKHLMEELETLRAEEFTVRRLLGLRATPRLTLVDEETTTLVTASKRGELAAAAEDDEDA